MKLSAILPSSNVKRSAAWRAAAATAERLLTEGRRTDLPVVVENCSRPDERILRLTLLYLARRLEPGHGLVLVMMGEALARREHQASAGGIT